MESREEIESSVVSCMEVIYLKIIVAIYRLALSQVGLYKQVPYLGNCLYDASAEAALISKQHPSEWHLVLY